MFDRYKQEVFDAPQFHSDIWSIKYQAGKHAEETLPYKMGTLA